MSETAPDFAVVRTGDRVKVRIEDRAAKWEAAMVTRGVLYVLSPAKGGRRAGGIAAKCQ